MNKYQKNVKLVTKSEEVEDFVPTVGYETMQANIDSGIVWLMEGHMGRCAMSAIECGDCVLGKVARKNAYGGFVGSRYDVVDGTKGSIAYANKMRKEYAEKND